jgi:hypothetical protein
MNYYIVCNSEKILERGEKILRICNTIPRIMEVLSQYKTRDGITPKKVDNIQNADFVVRIDRDMAEHNPFDSMYNLHNKMKTDMDEIMEIDVSNLENRTRFKKPVMFINFINADNASQLVDQFVINNRSQKPKDPKNIYVELHFSNPKMKDHNDILLEENEELTRFMKALNHDLIFTPMPTNNWKILYWFLGFVAICLIAFGLYRLYRKYKKQ